MIRRWIRANKDFFRVYLLEKRHEFAVRHVFCTNLYRALCGYFLICRLRNKYGRDVHIFLLRGATGDIYLNGRLLREFMKENRIANYVLAGDGKGLGQIAGLFEFRRRAALNNYQAHCLQVAYTLWGGTALHMTDLFLWEDTLKFNRCRLRMTERFHFMHTYIWYIYNLKEPFSVQSPHFAPMNRNLKIKFKKLGLKKGATIVISPFAYSVQGLTCEFWNWLGNVLERKGYTILINADWGQEQPFLFKCILCSYRESVPLLEYAGGFIGVRSGFCDIVSQADCKKVILYPKPPNPLNYSVHRSDMQYSGLKIMGLTDHVTELSTWLLKDVTNPRADMRDAQKEYEEMRRLVEKISGEFELRGLQS